MKRILIYGMSNKLGGVEMIIKSIIQRLNKDLFCVDIILPLGECLYENQLDSFCVYRLPLWGNKPIRFRNELKKLLKQNSYDYIWINLSVFANITILNVIKKYSNSKIILHSHGSSFECSNKFKRLVLIIMHACYRRFYLKHADLFFACSKNAANWLYGKKFTAQQNVMIINNGIDISKFSFDIRIRELYRKQMGIENKHVLLHVGRFSEVKNHIFLLNLMMKFMNRHMDFILFFVGEGELINSIKQKVYSMGLSDCVYFLGQRKDISALMQMADIFLLPSFHERFPVTIVEAQAASLPCVVSDSITKEVKITDLVHFVSLREPEEVWIDTIVECTKCSKQRGKELGGELEKFSIVNVVIDLEKQLL